VAKKRVFISFDYDHDSDLKTLLVGQAKHPDSPFDLADWSVKEPMTGNWKEKARTRIQATDLMVVICGEHTDTAAGVSAEVTIAQEEELPYFLLEGRKNKACKRPKAARATDKVYDWTWDNLKNLIGGSR
jgi:hypothetical protein